MGLGLRELGVLLACGVILLLALTQEGDLHMEPAWFQPIESSPMSQTSQNIYNGGLDHGQLMTTYANGIAPLENELVPAPLITDIDGDGYNEVVIVTREPKLKIFKFKSNLNVQAQSFNTLYSNNGINWEQLVLVHEVGLLSSLLMTSGRQIVGLSSGYIRPYSATKNRKQVIVVVNESWGIFVFNHRLKLMWTRSIESDLSLRYLQEVAILIDPHPMRKGGPKGNDTGVVIVGGRLALKSELNKNSYGLHQDSDPAGGPKPLEFPGDYAESLQGRILRPGRKRGFMVSDDPKDKEEYHTEALGEDPFHFEREQHFSYYAFEGKTGETRWKHDSTSFLEEAHPNEILKPQHEGVHSGEMDWRVFRRSILDVALPHTWTGGRESTWFDLVHVEKTRSGHQKQAIKKKRQIKSNFFVQDTLGLRPHKDTEHVIAPNALVVHLKDGIEILHLYSGRPLCRLTLKPGEVHVDLNGDGVIDHVEALGGVHTPRSRGTHSAHDIKLPKCLAMVRSGVPPNRQLFNASICQTSWSNFMKLGPGGLRGGAAAMKESESGSLDGGLASAGSVGRGSASAFSLEGGIGSTETPNVASEAASFVNKLLKDDADGQLNLRVAHPIVIQEPRTIGKPAKKRRFHPFFFLSNGLVTSFNHDGSRTWHTQTKAIWLKSHSQDALLSAAESSFRPTLTPYGLHADSTQPSDHVLVIGERMASIVSFGGHLRAELPLARDLVVAPPVIGDFDNDGLNDFAVVTTKGFYGYRVTRRLGGQLFSILVIGLLFILGAVFAFKIAQSSSLQSVASSYRSSQTHNKSKTTFTGGLRQMGKSAKAQL